ncbi:MAG: hypothetical protein AAF727_15960 [Pseudomonadota bacterium]
MPILSISLRLRCATLVALSGGAVAQTMSLWGGEVSMFLPDFTDMLWAGVLGAGAAGLLFGDLFGRAERTGVMWAMLGWAIATLVGAMFGAGAVIAYETNAPLANMGTSMMEGAPLGVLALVSGVTGSPIVAAVWVLSGLAVHCATRAERSAPT